MKRLCCCLYFILIHFVTAAQFTSSDLPIVVINTNGQVIPDDPKIMADMGIIWNENNARNNITDTSNHYEGKIGIEVRGQSSQMFPMKSYGLELWNSSGNSINRSLFGLPQESDWILYAPYNDKTLMHNVLAYQLSNQMGHWAAHCRYVELVLNGEYKGIYVFMERIKRKNGRVNIPSMGSGDNAGDAVTGGYIFSIDKEANGWFSHYPAGAGSIQYSYVYPKEDNITDAQKAWIKNFTDSFENALASPGYSEATTGWRKFADENSFIDYFIVNELSRNVDGYRISSYFHKDRYSNGGKIKAGPVWDYDLAFRNADYCNGANVDGWSYQFNTVCPGDFWQVPFWWDRLMADTGFKAALRCRWQELRSSTLSLNNLYNMVDSIAALTAEARQRHFVQWPVLGQYVWPNPQPIPATYEEEIRTLKQWLSSRLDWMDKNMPNSGACAEYPSTVSSSFVISKMPNPLRYGDNILVQSRENQLLSVKVMDAAGRLMWYSSFSLTAGNNYLSIPVQGWAAGLYFFEFRNAKGEQVTKRIIK